MRTAGGGSKKRYKLSTFARVPQGDYYSEDGSNAISDAKSSAKNDDQSLQFNNNEVPGGDYMNDLLQSSDPPL